MLPLNDAIRLLILSRLELAIRKANVKALETPFVSIEDYIEFVEKELGLD